MKKGIYLTKIFKKLVVLFLSSLIFTNVAFGVYAADRGKNPSTQMVRSGSSSSSGVSGIGVGDTSASGRALEAQLATGVNPAPGISVNRKSKIKQKLVQPIVVTEASGSRAGVSQPSPNATPTAFGFVKAAMSFHFNKNKVLFPSNYQQDPLKPLNALPIQVITASAIDDEGFEYLRTIKLPLNFTLKNAD